MSQSVSWIAAVADNEYPITGMPGIPAKIPAENKNARSQISKSPALQNQAPVRTLPQHNFPPVASRKAPQQREPALDRNPDLWLYRNRTAALLRRYLRVSLETGRLPSLLGRDFFRAKVTSYTASTFEDRVIFVRDVEMCLHRLRGADQQLVACVILQEHDQWEAARILNCGRATVQRRLYDVLDLLSEDFLRVGLLVAIPDNDAGTK